MSSPYKAAGMREPVHDRIVDKITELAHSGVRKVTEMKRHITTFVKQLFQGRDMPPPTRCRYYPSDTDIRNYMQSARSMLQHSKVKFIPPKNSVINANLFLQGCKYRVS